MAYWAKGGFYFSDDMVNWINYTQKAASLNRGAELPALLWNIGLAYFCAGFPDIAKQYYQDKLKLDGDSLSYYYALAGDEYFLANFAKSIEYGKKGYAIDSTSEGVLNYLGANYEWIGQYEESLKYYKKYYERLKAKGEFYTGFMHRIGYDYWQIGNKEEAEYYFNGQIKYCNKSIELKRSSYGLYAYYDLAGVYAFKGERDKAYKNLRIFNQIQRIPLWMSMLIKTDPLFNSIRNEPEFQQIVRDIEAKYQAEHERVRKWLEDQGKL
jgi:tetratricopeptide (TPR) repeat protein